MGSVTLEGLIMAVRRQSTVSVCGGRVIICLPNRLLQHFNRGLSLMALCIAQTSLCLIPCMEMMKVNPNQPCKGTEPSPRLECVCAKPI